MDGLVNTRVLLDEGSKQNINIVVSILKNHVKTGHKV